MKRFINITISVITLLALIIILVIGLDIQSLKLGSFTNAQNINSILIYHIVISLELFFTFW